MHHELDPLGPQSDVIKLVRNSLPQACFHHTVLITTTGERFTYGGLHKNKKPATRFQKNLEHYHKLIGNCQEILLEVRDTYRVRHRCGRTEILIHGRNDGTHGSQRKTT